MKKTLLALLTVTLLGCATTTKEQLDSIAMDARDIATLATQAALMEDPNFKDEIILTRDALLALESLPPGQAATIDDLAAALSKLPVAELKTQKGQLYITGGRILLRRFTGLVTKPDFDIGASGAVQLFASALRQGIDDGL